MQPVCYDNSNPRRRATKSTASRNQPNKSNNNNDRNATTTTCPSPNGSGFLLPLFFLFLFRFLLRAVFVVTGRFLSTFYGFLVLRCLLACFFFPSLPDCSVDTQRAFLPARDTRARIEPALKRGLWGKGLAPPPSTSPPHAVASTRGAGTASQTPATDVCPRDAAAPTPSMTYRNNSN